MRTKLKKLIPRVIKGRDDRVELRVPYYGKELIFAYPFEDGGSYETVGKRILRRGLLIPTAEQTAFLIHAAFKLLDKTYFEEFDEIVHLMVNNGRFWIFNRNLWTSKGVYVVQDSEAVGDRRKLNLNNLEKGLRHGKEIEGVRFSRDGKIRFAPIETYDDYPLPTENGFLIASYGIEGIKKLEEVADLMGHYSLEIDTHALEFKKSGGEGEEEYNKPIQTLSLLVEEGGCDEKLCIVCDRRNVDPCVGYGFGLYK